MSIENKILFFISVENRYDFVVIGIATPIAKIVHQLCLMHKTSTKINAGQFAKQIEFFINRF